MTLAEYRKRRGPPEALAKEAAEREGGARAHPGPLEYAKIGAVLAAVTAVEVAIYYMGISHTALVAMLLVLSAVKFSLVVLWFMHLRFDNPIFSQMFVAAFLLALVILAVAVATLRGSLV